MAVMIGGKLLLDFVFRAWGILTCLCSNGDTYFTGTTVKNTVSLTFYSETPFYHP